MGSRRGSRRVSSLGYVRSCCTISTVTGTIGGCQISPDSARCDAGTLTVGGTPAEELAEAHGTPLVVLCEEIRSGRARTRCATLWATAVCSSARRRSRTSPAPAPPRGGIGADVAAAGELAFARQRAHGRRARRPREQQGREFLGQAAATEALPSCSTRPTRLRCSGRRRRARARPRDARRRRRYARGDPHGHHGLEVRLPPDLARTCSSPTRSTAVSTCSASTSTSDRSSRTSTRRPRRSCGSRRSPRGAATSLAGSRALPTSAADSDPAPPRGRRPDAASLADERRDHCPDGVPRGRAPAARDLARARPEPRRPAGVTLYRVGSVKRLPGRTWVAVDGGMSDNPRPQLYDARYTAVSATRPDEPRRGRASQGCTASRATCSSTMSRSRTAPRRPPRRARDWRLHAGDGLQLQRRHAPGGGARPDGRQPSSADARPSTTSCGTKPDDDAADRPCSSRRTATPRERCASSSSCGPTTAAPRWPARAARREA